MKTKIEIVLFCSLLLSPWTRADEWPQWRGPERDGVWKETGVVQSFKPEGIPFRWRAEIGGGYTGPTVAREKVYVMDRQSKPKDRERILCFDWKTGKQIWMHEYACSYGRVKYPAGPRASVTIDDGRAYSLGSTGYACCMDADTGEVLWEKDFDEIYGIELPIWGISASPLIEGDLVIYQIGGKDGACLVALDKVTGEETWKALDDPASYSSPIVIDQAGERVLVCWTGTRVVGLDPKTGEAFYNFEIGFSRWVIAIATPVIDGDRLFVSAVDKGSAMFRLAQDKPGIEKLWWQLGTEDDPKSLHSLINTPVIVDNHIFGIGRDGIFRCVNGANGDRVWEDQTAVPKGTFATLHFVQNGDKIWIFNERGELIISQLNKDGFKEISRAKLLDPTRAQFRQRGGVTWSHPAFAYRHVFARNDKELVCGDLRSGE
ncbi:MAG: PQQ-binding-like beta-propeller repeat protein [Verrucomicrobiota bacterium]